MSELTREEKLKLVEKLPQRLQDLLYSEDTGAILLYLGQKYNLPDEKVRLLSKLVGDVVLGIVLPGNLIQEIIAKIISDPQIAANMAQELNDNLFAPVVSAPAPVIPLPVKIPTVPPASQQTEIPKIQLSPKPSYDQYREPVAGPEVIDLRKTPPLPILSPTPSERQNRGSSISQPRHDVGGEIGTLPVAAAPIPPSPKPAPPLTFTKPIEKPIEPINLIPVFRPQIPKAEPPLIEADPHQMAAPPAPPKNDTYREPVDDELKPPAVSEVEPPAVSEVEPPAVSEVEPPAVSEVEPQFIIRPPGLPPALPILSPTPSERQNRGSSISQPRHDVGGEIGTNDILDLRQDKGEF